MASPKSPTPSSVLSSYGDIAIVGLGLIGSSLAVALRRSGYTGRIVGVSRETTLSEALKVNVIDEGMPYDRLHEAVEKTGLTILCSPIETIFKHLETIGKLQAQAGNVKVITDVGSTKKQIVEHARNHLQKGFHFIGGHPMAGSEKNGLAARDPFLFQNSIYALTPAPGVPWEEVEKLGKFLGEVGARMVVLQAEVHDRLAAAISHLPQLLAVSLVNLLDELGEHRDQGIRFAAGGFRDMTRIASSPFDIWRDIYKTNKTEVREIAQLFTQQLQKTCEEVGNEELRDRFDHAAQTRSQIPLDTKGFLRPLWAILVLIEDRPGLIADITSSLAGANLNIKDIEILKMRENEGGTLRLAFSTRREAESALTVLTQQGFEAKLRD